MTRKWFFFACFLVLPAGSSLWAQPKDSLKFQSGWGVFLNNVRQDVWSQWNVKLSNQGDSVRRARVGCFTQRPDGGQDAYTREVTLPEYSSREMSLAFQPGVPKKDPKRGQGAEQRYVLWDSDTGQQVQTTTGILTYVPPEATAIGISQIHRVEHDESSYLKSSLPRSPLGQVQLTMATLANLPDRWYGYSQVKIFALGGVTSSELRATQIEAILQWVRGGGCLMLLGGEELPDLLNGPLGQAAGVRALGVHYIDSLNVRQLTKPSDKPIPVTLPWPLPMAELYALDAEVLYESDGLPVLTLRRLGEGCILTSAVPIGAYKPRGDFNIWPDVAKIQDAKPAIDSRAFLDPGWATLQQIAGRRGPERFVPAGILAVLLGGVVVLGTILRLVRRGEWLWILLVPLGLAVSVGLFHYSRQLGDPQRLSHISLLTGLGEDQVRVQEAFAYFSGPEVRTVSPSSGNPAGLIRELGRSTAAAMNVTEIRTTALGTELPEQRIEPNDTRGFYTRTILPVPIVKGSLRFDETGLVGELTNHLPDDIEDAVLMVNYRTYRLGTLPADQSTPIRIGNDDLLGMVRFPMPKTTGAKPGRGAKSKSEEPRDAERTPSAEGEFSSAIMPDKLQTALVRRLITQPDFQTDISGGTRLIGYAASGGLNPLREIDSQKQGWSVVNWPIPVTYPPTGGKVFLPAGWVNLDIRAMNWDARHKRFIEVTRDAKVILAAGPSEKAWLEDLSAEIVIDVRAIDYRLEVQGVPPRKNPEFVSLGVYDRPNGEIRLSVPDADRFRDAHGRVVLQLDVTRAELDLPDLGAGSNNTKLKTSTVAGAPWLLRRVDVSLKGTVR